MITFHTENISHRLYRVGIWWMMRSMFTRKQRSTFSKFWKIDIYPSTMASEEPAFHGTDGRGGFTGKFEMKLYIVDEKTSRHDMLMAHYRSNFVVIAHEFAHAALWQFRMSKRVPLRNGDTSGHERGTELSYHTAEVHDRESENKYYVLKFPYYFIGGFKLYLRRITINIVDVRDLVRDSLYDKSKGDIDV